MGSPTSGKSSFILLLILRDIYFQIDNCKVSNSVLKYLLFSLQWFYLTKLWFLWLVWRHFRLFQSSDIYSRTVFIHPAFLHMSKDLGDPVFFNILNFFKNRSDGQYPQWFCPNCLLELFNSFYMLSCYPCSHRSKFVHCLLM